MVSGETVPADVSQYNKGYANNTAYRPVSIPLCSDEGTEPPHIHVRTPDGECKFWLEPILLASNRSLKPHTLREIEKLVYANLDFLKEKYHEFHNA